MITVLSAKDMRASDTACISAGTDSRELMRRAGNAVFEAVRAEAVRYGDKGAAIVCGSGNNAGDGYVLALRLKENGIPCTIFLLKEKFSADGLYFFEKCRDSGIAWELCTEGTDLRGFGLIADCIFGTGFRGKPEGMAADIIEKINEARQSGAFTVSVDINSGLNADTGMGEVVAESDLTVSIGCYKPGHFLNMAKDVIKRKLNADIGIPPIGESCGLLEASDVRQVFPARRNLSNKGDYGYVALIGGSLSYSGAIRLAAKGNQAASGLAALGNAAMRAGAGVASIATPASICPIIAGSILEPTLIPLAEENGSLKFDQSQFDAICRRYKLIAFGMGAGGGEETLKAVRYLLENCSGTLILDADGLNALAKLEAEDPGRYGTGDGSIRPSGQKLILTPHLKEFSRLADCSINDIMEDPIGRTKALAGKFGAIVMQKGPSTIISDGEKVIITDRGCPGMATAGSGDVLSGILAAVCYGAAASGDKDKLLLAAASAAWINGAAGELAQSKSSAVTMTAGDTAANVSEVINSLISE